MCQSNEEICSPKKVKTPLVSQICWGQYHVLSSHLYPVYSVPGIGIGVLCVDSFDPNPRR